MQLFLQNNTSKPPLTPPYTGPSSGSIIRCRISGINLSWQRRLGLTGYNQQISCQMTHLQVNLHGKDKHARTCYEDRLTIIQMWMNGTSIQTISKSIGRSRATVYRWLQRWREERSLRDKTREISYDLHWRNCLSHLYFLPRRNISDLCEMEKEQIAFAQMCDLNYAAALYQYSKRQILIPVSSQPLETPRYDYGSRLHSFLPDGLTHEDLMGHGLEISLLRASLVLDCTTLFVTDVNSSLNIFQAMSILKTKHPTVFIDVQDFEHRNIIAQHTLKIKQTSSCITTILISDDIDILTNIIQTSFENGLFNNPNRILLLTRRTPASLYMVQEQLAIGNAAIVNIKELKTHQRCGVYVYLPYTHKIVQVAFWTPKYGLGYVNQKTFFPDKNRRLTEGGHLNIAAIYYPPHSIMKIIRDENGSSLATVTGPVMEALKMLSRAINFTYTIMPFTAYGNLLPNGSWNGMVGSVRRKEADIALGPLAITYARAKVVQYTVPIFVDYLHIQGKRGATEVDPWAFAMPFEPEVWAALFAMLALAIIVSFIYGKITFHSLRSKDSAFNYFRILLQQDIKEITISWWERMLIGGWALTVLISVESYSGNLMSQLAVRYISQPYQSLRLVLDDPKIKMIMVGNSVYEQYVKLQTAVSGIFLEVAKSDEAGKIDFKESSASFYVTSVMGLVATGSHVIVMPYLSLKLFFTEAFTDKGNCRFYLSREKYLPFTFAMIVQNNSPLSQSINDGLRGIVEGGLYNYWLEKEVPLAKGCKNPPTKITVKASLSLSELWVWNLFDTVSWVCDQFVYIMPGILFNLVSNLYPGQKMNDGHVYTFKKIQDRIRMIQLWRNGVTIKDIAERSGCSVTTVYRWINRWQTEGSIYDKQTPSRPRVALRASNARSAQSVSTDFYDNVVTYAQYQQHIRAFHFRAMQNYSHRCYGSGEKQ
ncbi:uncharacterized protein [Palaemon carinicauda]|uniref:uncharacterized protein n=1 Tax=Palaemon carinicauda TaxID=392227 RepID=UPI0035B5AADF